MTRKTLLRTFALLLIMCMLLTFSACFELGYVPPQAPTLPMHTANPTATDSAAPVTDPAIVTDSALEIYFIDVGQGDSALLISPTGKTMLIDAGERSAFTKISILLESLDIDSLDTVVATHPHSDHIGGMTDVIKNYPIGEFYMPEFEYDSKTYTNMINALDEYDVDAYYLYGGEGETLDWDEYVTVECLSPLEDIEYDDANNVSIMLRFTYGGTTALFTGDCERYAEASMMYMLPDQNLSSDVLKMGHHGSSTSSHDKFLKAVNPEYAVISCGYENSYGHPHHETLTALEEINARVLRTDEQGTIHLTLDGKGVIVNGR